MRFRELILFANIIAWNYKHDKIISHIVELGNCEYVTLRCTKVN